MKLGKGIVTYNNIGKFWLGILSLSLITLVSQAILKPKSIDLPRQELEAALECVKSHNSFKIPPDIINWQSPRNSFQSVLLRYCVRTKNNLSDDAAYQKWQELLNAPKENRRKLFNEYFYSTPKPPKSTP